jgi:hypothetical protein
MQKIKTLCIIGDFQDPIRDSMFIKKYEEDKIMKVFKTKNANEDESKIVQFVKTNI